MLKAFWTNFSSGVVYRIYTIWYAFCSTRRVVYHSHNYFHVYAYKKKFRIRRIFVHTVLFIATSKLGCQILQAFWTNFSSGVVYRIYTILYAVCSTRHSNSNSNSLSSTQLNYLMHILQGDIKKWTVLHVWSYGKIVLQVSVNFWLKS